MKKKTPFLLTSKTDVIVFYWVDKLSQKIILDSW